MAMRNTLLAAAGLIAVMVIVLLYFDDDSKHGMLISSESDEVISINDARKAFWERDLLKAERLYRIMTKTDVDNINAWGELGNIYYLQARWKEAAKAYTEVTLRLIDKKNMRQAAFLHHLVSQMDQEQLARINQRLQSLRK